MADVTAYHQLGKFVVGFQALEELLNEVIALIARSDQESVQILTNELEFSKRLKAAEVLFARFVGINTRDDGAATRDFHSVIVELYKLSERRNELVHSSYHEWRDVDGNSGLLRKHSKLRGSAGKREVTEEALQPDDFNVDLERLDGAAVRLEAQRRTVIAWQYPDFP